jgi:hypothetical protein
MLGSFVGFVVSLAGTRLLVESGLRYSLSTMVPFILALIISLTFRWLTDMMLGAGFGFVGMLVGFGVADMATGSNAPDSLFQYSIAGDGIVTLLLIAVMARGRGDG